jgi:hypothetical protein
MPKLCTHATKLVTLDGVAETSESEHKSKIIETTVGRGQYYLRFCQQDTPDFG